MEHGIVDCRKCEDRRSCLWNLVAGIRAVYHPEEEDDLKTCYCPSFRSKETFFQLDY